MYIKNVMNLCKSTGIIDLYTGKVQYLGNGNAIYPLHDAPIFNEASLAATFDLNEKQRNTIKIIDKPVPVNTADNDPNEVFVERSDITITLKGLTVIPLYTSEGLAFIQEKYLAPFGRMTDIEIYERRFDNGKIYLAIKKGWSFMGAIMPVDMYRDGKMLETLRQLYNQCAYGAEKYAERESAESDQAKEQREKTSEFNKYDKE